MFGQESEPVTLKRDVDVIVVPAGDKLDTSQCHQRRQLFGSEPLPLSSSICRVMSQPPPAAGETTDPARRICSPA